MNALRPGDARFYNLGIGRGYSVREVIDAAAARHRAARSPSSTARAGPAIRPCSSPTPTRSAANSAGRRSYTEIDPIVATAWNWFQRNPDGYK